MIHVCRQEEKAAKQTRKSRTRILIRGSDPKQEDFVPEPRSDNVRVAVNVAGRIVYDSETSKLFQSDDVESATAFARAFLQGKSHKRVPFRAGEVRNKGRGWRGASVT